jgi:hypothetical protein
LLRTDYRLEKTIAPGWRLGKVGAARSTEDWEDSECSYGYFGSKRGAAEVGSAYLFKKLRGIQHADTDG